MDEAQKIRDRKIRGVRSSSRANEDIRRTERAESIIEDLEHHGPANLIHIAVLSNIIEKSIKIWNTDSTLNNIVGRERKGQPINIEYHANDFGGIGHWTLMHAKDPDNTQFDLNSCLFSVIGSQTGLNPLELRRWTVLRLKDNLRQLADRLDEIFRLEGINNEMILMIGGARYCGTSPRDARIILDKSQNCFTWQLAGPAHPRAHVSNPSAKGKYDCVENYSRETKTKKSGFLSRTDQDVVVHFMLLTQNAKNFIASLNLGYYYYITLKLSVDDFLPNRNFNIKAKWFQNGESDEQQHDVQEVCIIAGHHPEHYRDNNADIIIHTCYPILS